LLKLSHASAIGSIWRKGFQSLRAILDGGQWTYPFPVLGLCTLSPPSFTPKALLGRHFALELFSTDN
jgi:hypothetical protein